MELDIILQNILDALEESTQTKKEARSQYW